jgi:hypothetical protein
MGLREMIAAERADLAEFLRTLSVDDWVDSTGCRNTSIGRCVDGTAKRVGSSSDRTACDAVAGSASGGAARASATVLEGDR